VRIYNRYIISLTLIFGLTTVILSISKQSLDVYYSIYLIECLVVTLLFSHLNPRAQRGLSRVGYVLFAGFLFLVATKAVEIIVGVKIL